MEEAKATETTLEVVEGMQFGGSVASVLLLTEATLTEAPEPKKEPVGEPLG